MRFYHGTSLKAYKSIEKEGLWAVVGRLSTKLEMSKMFASWRALNDKSVPVIIRIDLPQKWSKYIKEGEPGEYEYFSTRTIPTKYMKRICHGYNRVMVIIV